MTDNQKKKKTELVLETWTELRTKLEKVVYLVKKRELIKDALETHLSQASSFIRATYYNAWDGMPEDYQITPLTEPTVPEYDIERGVVCEEGKEYQKKKSWNAYLSQRKRNERIIEECKELLEKLEGI